MQNFLTYSFIFISVIMSAQTTVFNFSKDANLQYWQIINDGVMGGLSESKMMLSESGHGVFSGHISLANNGGFASTRLLTDVEVNPDEQYVILKLKGDGKTYQFRLKGERNQRQSYVQEFDTNGEWQNIKLKISDFSPQFRGRQLDSPNFNFSKIQEVRFLIGNKKEEDFELMIDSISLSK